MAYGNTNTDRQGDIPATTLKRHGRKVVNAIFDGTPLTKKLIMDHKVKWDGGKRLDVPVRGRLNNTAGAIEGYDTFNLAKQENLALASYDWKSFRVTLGISEDEKADNSGPYAMVKLLGDRLFEARETQIHVLEKQWLKLTAGTKEFSTLNQICNNAATYSTYAGIDGADSDNAKWWKPQTFGLAANTAITTKILKQQKIAVQGATAWKPDICLMDSNSYIDVDELAEGKRRYVDERMGTFGFETLLLWGATFMFTDEPTISTNQTGKTRAWYWLTTEFLNLYCHNKTWMKLLGPIQRPDQPQVDWYTYYSRGQLVCTNRRRQGLATIAT